MLLQIQVLWAVSIPSIKGCYRNRRVKQRTLMVECLEPLMGYFMHVKARSIDNGSASLDKEVKQIIKDRTIPEPTVKMVLPVKHDVIEVNNDGVRSLLAEFMYGWPLEYRTDMVLVTDYEDTRYYYNLQFYRHKLPEGIRMEQLRQMIMDAQFSYK